MRTVRVALLGEQTISDTSGRVLTQSPRVIALIAFLVVHAGVPQIRQRMAELFWPDSTDSQALTNLRRELHNLRQVLGEEERSLVVSPRCLCWRDAATCRVDARVFELEAVAASKGAAAGDENGVLRCGAAALAEYRGELLPGNREDWVLDARAEIAGRCVAVCDLLSAARARRGDLTGAVQVSRRRIQLEPLEELGYRRLMELEAELGDTATAISTYHRCCSVLERELGVAPDRATRQMASRLLAPVRRDDALTATATESVATRSGFAAEFVGRRHELAVLDTVWQTASIRGPSVALVHGAAGVGKTRLLAEVAERVRGCGAVVARSRCFGTSERLALAPVAEWLREPSMQSVTANLDPVWRTEVDRLTSPTHSGRSDASARAMVDAWQRHQFFEGLAHALIGVRRPMLLVLDNMQWCDIETLSFVAFLLGRHRDVPLMVAAARRDETPGENIELGRWISGMRANELLTDLPLGPLSVAETARLAEAICGTGVGENDKHLLHATTGGFPLYIVEASRTLVDLDHTRLPVRDMAAVLRGRIEQTSPGAQEIAGLAATIGRDFTLDLLIEASDLDPESVVRSVDELWRRRIVHQVGDGYDFSHGLLRDAASAMISPPKRWLLHRRIAQALELMYAGEPDAVCAQLAQHYAHGGRPMQAVHYFRRAAEMAANTFAHAESIRLDKQALAIVRGHPRGKKADKLELEILEAMAAPLNARYGYASVELQHTLERSIRLAEELGRTDAVVSALVALFGTRFVQGQTSDAHRAATRALSLAEPGSESCGSAHFACGGAAITLGRPGEALHHFRLAAGLTRHAKISTIGTQPYVHACAWAAHAHWLRGQNAAAVSSCHDALDLARELGHPYTLALALAFAGITFQLHNQPVQSGEAVAELGELCARYGFGYYREWGLVLTGWCRTDRSGLELARQGIANLRSQGSLARMPYWLSLLADLLARGGRADAARATLDAALVDGFARDDVWWLPEVMRMRAAYDDELQAATRLRAAARLASTHGSVALVRRCERDLARIG